MRKAVWVTAVLVILSVSLVGATALDRPFDNSAITTQTPTPAASHSPTPSPIPTITNSTPNPSFGPYDFNMHFTWVPGDFNITNTLNMIQGGKFEDQMTLSTISGNTLSVNTSDVIWSADTGSSGIQCSFSSTSYADPGFTSQFFGDACAYGFNSMFMMTVPSSIPTNNYTVTITAKIGSVSHSISFLVSVRSSVVTVSGTVNVGSSGITPYQIQFHDLRFPTDGYFATITGNTYSISIPNNAVYFVRVSKAEGLSYLWYNCDTFFQLEVSAGSTSMTQDFTVLGS
jgi:hypothetical protein